MSSPPRVKEVDAAQVAQWADRELRRRTEDGTARGSILLASPNGSVYSVRVADDGTLNTTLESSG